MSAPSPYLKPLPDEARLVRAWHTDGPLHLVGGAVRDWLLQRPIKDLDFVMPHGAVAFARQVADRLGAAFFVLDAKRDIARVILPAQPGRTVQVLDFAAYRGPTLEDDLRARDFTINALALDPLHPDRLVDPLRGLQDLKDKVLRLTHPRALEDDPLRVLRAVRLAVELDFRLHPATQAALPSAAPLLARVSAERQAEELFRVLEHPRGDAALRVLGHVGALAPLWPELDALRGLPPDATGRRPWDLALAAGHYVHRLAAALAPTYRPEDAANFALGLVSWRLGRYRRHLAEHWQQRLHAHRSPRGLTAWAAYYHNVGLGEGASPEDVAARSARLAARRARALHLSRAEIRRLRATVAHHAAVLAWAAAGQVPDARAVHRFFRAAGPAGVDAVLVALAVALARHSLSPPHAVWQRHVDVARALWQAWWEQREQVVAPRPLLRGDEVLALLDRPPGPWVGQALQALTEAQAAGEVTDRAQAEAWLRVWAQRHDPHRSNGDGRA